jgi:DNA repair protein RecO (recombination protein O)
MDDDRLVTILTPDCGVVSAIARGANRPRGKLAASTEQFCYSRLVLFRYRDSSTIDSAEIDTSFFELRSDLEGLALASYFAELCCELAPKEEEAGEYLRLLLNSLHLIITHTKPLPLLKAIFELRLLTLAGFMPDLTGCAQCGAFSEADMLFSIESGRLFCAGHRPVGVVASEIPAGVLAAMRHIIYSDFKKLFSFSLSDEGIRVLAGFCERYLKYQVQRTYHSLEFYHAVASKGAPHEHTEGTP